MCSCAAKAGVQSLTSRCSKQLHTHKKKLQSGQRDPVISRTWRLWLKPSLKLWSRDLPTIVSFSALFVVEIIVGMREGGSGVEGRSLIFTSEEGEPVFCKFAQLTSWLILTVCLSLLHPSSPSEGCSLSFKGGEQGRRFGSGFSCRCNSHIQLSQSVEAALLPGAREEVERELSVLFHLNFLIPGTI